MNRLKIRYPWQWLEHEFAFVTRVQVPPNLASHFTLATTSAQQQNVRKDSSVQSTPYSAFHLLVVIPILWSAYARTGSVIFPKHFVICLSSSLRATPSWREHSAHIISESLSRDTRGKRRRGRSHYWVLTDVRNRYHDSMVKYRKPFLSPKLFIGCQSTKHYPKRLWQGCHDAKVKWALNCDNNLDPETF